MGAGATLAAKLLVLVLLFTDSPARAESPPAPASVEITYRLVAPAALPTAWDVLLRPLPAGEVVRHRAQPPEPLVLQLPAGSNWEVAADLPGFWVRRQNLVAGRGGERSRLELQLWPLGTISGRVEVRQKDLERPRKVTVETMAVPAFLQRPPVPPGILDCPVDEQGNWSCSVPAAKFDLAIGAEGFTPHYPWEVEVKPAKTLSLGTFALERGSSVAAWIAAEGGAIDPEHCIARLSPLAACDADLKAVARLSQTAVERPVGRDGFLQITGISPGNYSLEIRQPGFAAARVANVRVEPQRETFLPEPLVLARPIALQIEIAPPVDEVGEPWRAQVTRRAEGDSGPTPIVFDGPADGQGRFTVADQAPGWFRVVILDSQGNRVHSEPERQVDSSSQHTIELRRIAIEGRLRLGAEPLRGTLWFGGRSGARSVKMAADEEGRFTGVLSADGFWVVDIEGGEPAFRARDRVEIRADRDGRATVSIDLPDTRVFGRIVDERGQPVAGAGLELASQSLDQFVQTDDAGSFDVRGLPAGSLALMAADSQARQSERTVLEIVDGRSVGPVELRLRSTKELSGTVLSSRGPVAGARVVLRAFSPTIGGGDAATGPEGTFTLKIPQNVAAATVVVRAPGHGTKAFPVVAGEKPLALTLPQGAGEIAIALPRGVMDLFRENLRVILFQDGMEVPVNLLRAGAGPQALPDAEPILRLADLAPGGYSACLAHRQVESKGAALEPAAKDAAVTCDSGQLTAGGTLALTLRE